MTNDDVLAAVAVSWRRYALAHDDLAETLGAGRAAGLTWDELAEPLVGSVTGAEPEARAEQAGSA